MSLTSSLQIGRSALTASQIAIQVTGNNFANAATPGYSRQVATLAPTRDANQGGFFLGRGVFVQDVRRQVDSALLARLNASISQEAAAGTDLGLLSQVESTLNELSDSDISSELSRFFNTWSELANSPGSGGARSLVVQQGATLAAFLKQARKDLIGLRTQLDSQVDANVARADDLLGQVAALNQAIVTAEAGSAQSNGLRDQRDQLIEQLSQLMDISTVEQPSGSVDVLVGSIPVVLAGRSRGLEVDRQTIGSSVDVRVRLKDDPQTVTIQSGTIGSLLTQRTGLVNDTVERLDQVASQLIFQINRMHSSGYSASPLTSVTGTRAQLPADTARALNDPGNSSLSGLPFAAVTGGFNVTVTNTATGAYQTVRINVDLDGIDSTGAAGFGDDTSVASIASDLGGIPNLTATVQPDGTLKLTAATGFTFSFSDDTSGALAVLGVNTYFTGTDASDIGVRQALADTPALLCAGRYVNGSPSDNGTAMTIAGLQDQANQALGGRTIRESWQDAVQSVGLRADSARTRAEATGLVRQNLDAQRSAVSGVSVDEESINMLSYQRQYQGAARFITAVDEMTQTLLALIGT